jgi:hypothetical protein
MSPTQAIEVPEEFLCPITLSVMQHPMMTRTGISFEKRAILQWLDVNGSCPLTRTPLPPGGLVSNRNLQLKIMKWKSQHLEKDYDCGDNDPASECVAAPPFLETFHALLEKEMKSEFESKQRKDLAVDDFASLDFEEGLDLALAMFES